MTTEFCKMPPAERFFIGTPSLTPCPSARRPQGEVVPSGPSQSASAWDMLLDPSTYDGKPNSSMSLKKLHWEIFNTPGATPLPTVRREQTPRVEEDEDPFISPRKTWTPMHRALEGLWQGNMMEGRTSTSKPPVDVPRLSFAHLHEGGGGALYPSVENSDASSTDSEGATSSEASAASTPESTPRDRGNLLPCQEDQGNLLPCQEEPFPQSSGDPSPRSPKHYDGKSHAWHHDSTPRHHEHDDFMTPRSARDARVIRTNLVLDLTAHDEVAPSRSGSSSTASSVKPLPLSEPSSPASSVRPLPLLGPASPRSVAGSSEGPEPRSEPDEEPCSPAHSAEGSPMEAEKRVSTPSTFHMDSENEYYSDNYESSIDEDSEDEEPPVAVACLSPRTVNILTCNGNALHGEGILERLEAEIRSRAHKNYEYTGITCKEANWMAAERSTIRIMTSPDEARKANKRLVRQENRIHDLQQRLKLRDDRIKAKDKRIRELEEALNRKNAAM